MNLSVVEPQGGGGVNSLNHHDFVFVFPQRKKRKHIQKVTPPSKVKGGGVIWTLVARLLKTLFLYLCVIVSNFLYFSLQTHFQNQKYQ